VPTEEKLGEIGDKLEYLPCKCLKQLAKQAPVSTTVALRATKKLHLVPFEIRQLQAVEEDDRRETHVCNWFLWVVPDSVLDPKLLFFY
jgi:hypothetical protein